MRTIKLPLHYGSIPRWLFNRMKKLAKEISEIIILDYGTEKFLELLSNPIWFQAFSNILGFDWHSSGSTTATIYALKEGLKDFDNIFVFGGKGKDAIKTIEEIKKFDETGYFEEISRLTAKVDNVLLQDGYDLYIHSIIIDDKGNWVVIQQGMNEVEGYARRYHWFSKDLEDFFEEPHSNIISDHREDFVVDLTSRKSRETRKFILDYIREPQNSIFKDLEELKRKIKENEIVLPKEHFIKIPENIKEKLMKIQKINPKDLKELLLIRGVGKETFRAFALISYLIYGNPLSFEDPLLFSFAHGGKDGFPFFVKRKVYDKSLEILEDVIQDLKVGKRKKAEMMKKIAKFLEE